MDTQRTTPATPYSRDVSRPHLDVAGISIDCSDPVELARFYLALLGGELLWENFESAGI